MDALIGAALPAIRGLHLAALLCGLGVEAFRLLSLRLLATSVEGAVLLRRMDSCVRLSAIVALGSAAAWFWLQGSVMLGRPIDDIETAATIAGTSFGTMLGLRSGLLVLAIGLLRGGRLASAAVLPVLAAATLLQGGLGHGAATDPWTTAALGLHVLAARVDLLL